jgi:hypothetical protein
VQDLLKNRSIRDQALGDHDGSATEVRDLCSP